MKSTFLSDLEKERELATFLDDCYTKGLENYTFERIYDVKRQLSGIDLLFTHHQNGAVYAIDEKAQLDYINEALPTFAFELQYEKYGVLKNGWLFDTKKKTEFYSLITSIYSDEPKVFTSCKITFVNRAKLLQFLGERNITEKSLQNYINKKAAHRPKLEIAELNPRTEGYLYFSTQNKAEKPINLILKLDFLIENGVAQRFI